MKKVKFTTKGLNGSEIKGVTAIDSKYDLLSLLLLTQYYPPILQEKIEELKSIKTGERSFAEVAKPYGNILSIGFNCGELRCDKETAFFITEDPNSYQSFEMPLQELIDLLIEWKAFLKS
jgi:hypothetical protein